MSITYIKSINMLLLSGLLGFRVENPYESSDENTRAVFRSSRKYQHDIYMMMWKSTLSFHHLFSLLLNNSLGKENG